MSKNAVKNLCIIGSVILLIAVCGAVFSYMFHMTDDKINQFTPAVVDCEVQEKTDLPMTEKNGIKVKNTGNIDAYLRLRFVSYWVRVNEAGDSEIVSKPSELPGFTIAEGWLAGKDNTYYFKYPVSPGQLTGDLLAAGAVIPLKEEDGYQQVIEVFSEAIQSNPVLSVEESWRVELDTDGNIVSVPT